jgi:hypothetical protein
MGTTPTSGRAAAVAPPAHAWDWVGRQRLVWSEARRRLLPLPPVPSSGGATRSADVPDWSHLLGDPPRAHPEVAARTDAAPGPDWGALATRADVMAALRAAYPRDPTVRAALDGAVTDLAFLGRRAGPLGDLGLRTAPRGLRWWWEHLGGTVEAEAVSQDARPSAAPAAQLRFDDVMAGYGDPDGVEWRT